MKKKVVCVTPAGRRKYMRLLIPQILMSDTVDRYDIWLNTGDSRDIAFLEYAASKYSKINIIPQPEGKVNGNKSINAFFKTACDEDSIYIRLDDDIVWIEPDFFDKMAKERLEDSSSFLLSPLVINNSICTHLLQQEGKYHYPEFLPAYSFSPLTWGDANFAYKLHDWFLKILEHNKLDNIKLHKRFDIALNRFSINSISWYGSVMKSFNAVILDDEEEYLTTIKGRELGKINKIIGNVVVGHFAFYSQRALLDESDLLDRYSLAAKKTYSYNPEFENISNDLESKIIEIEKDFIEKKLNENYFDKLKVKMKEAYKNIYVPIITFKKVGSL